MTQLPGEVEHARAVVADRCGDALHYPALHGLRWRFTFYDGAGGWSPNDVYVDDKIEALLDWRAGRGRNPPELHYSARSSSSQWACSASRARTRSGAS